MFIWVLLSIALHGGGGGNFIINTAKRCLLRLVKLQPGECVFLIHVGKFFPSFSYPRRVVFESVHLSIVFLDLPFSPTQILHGNCFTEKKTIQGSLHLICIINMLHKSATCERKRNKCSNKLDGSPHPPNAWSDLKFCEVRIFRRLLAFFVLFDYAVSVS